VLLQACAIRPSRCQARPVHQQGAARSQIQDELLKGVRGRLPVPAEEGVYEDRGGVDRDSGGRRVPDDRRVCSNILLRLGGLDQTEDQLVDDRLRGQEVQDSVRHHGPECVLPEVH
jgi:hypothetical protein